MKRYSQNANPHLTRQLDDLVRTAGGDTNDLSGKLVREMIHTAMKLSGDGADTGELKLISRSLKELRYALKIFRPYRGVRKVSIFGSARTPEDHVDYHTAAEFSRRMAQCGWMAITGAGGGIMQAGQSGAGRQASFGVAIRLPFEIVTNQYIAGDSKLAVFRYFFTRKLMFASQAHALVLFPGGFGTMDECFEIATLIQTGKAPLVPILMIDPPGRSFWKNWDRYVRDNLLADGMISADDLNLFQITNSVDQAVSHILNFYRNYHSQRYVRDELVLRLHRPLTDIQIQQLNTDFSPLITESQIRPSGPLETEQTHLSLPRLRLAFNRRDYGLLRLLINRINEYDAQNHAIADTS